MYDLWSLQKILRQTQNGSLRQIRLTKHRTAALFIDVLQNKVFLKILQNSQKNTLESLS